MKGLLPIVIVGGGGHATVVMDIINSTSKYNIIGFTDRDPKAHLSGYGIPCLGDDAILADLPRRGVLHVAIGVGGFNNRRRQVLYERIIDFGLGVPSLIHKGATVSPFAVVREGAVVMAGAIVGPGTQIAPNVIVNTGAVVDHHCVVGHSTLVGPAATLCGGVRVGERSFIGARACVVQYKNVGEDCVIGAGSVVLTDVAQGQTVVGNPARVLRWNSGDDQM